MGRTSAHRAPPRTGYYLFARPRQRRLVRKRLSHAIYNHSILSIVVSRDCRHAPRTNVSFARLLINYFVDLNLKNGYNDINDAIKFQIVMGVVASGSLLCIAHVGAAAGGCRRGVADVVASGAGA